MYAHRLLGLEPRWTDALNHAPISTYTMVCIKRFEVGRRILEPNDLVTLLPYTSFDETIY